jgi:hypothetical protein
MFVPNTFGMLSRRSIKNAYGEYSFAAPVRVPCAIVHSTRKNLKTPVRADSSASRGAAEEKIAVSKLLFPKTVAIDTNDKFEIDGKVLRVIGIEERKNVLGQLDHFEIDFEMFPA